MRYDAVVVGSGPNGLSSAITLQRAGLSVLLVERSEKVGGGMRSAELTLPGYIHDVCSSVHPMAVASEVFRQFPLSGYDVKFLHSPLALAHPFDDGTAAHVEKSIPATAAQFTGASSYRRLMTPLTENWASIRSAFLAPPHVPRRVRGTASFALNALLPASLFIQGHFEDPRARALFAGIAAHQMVPFEKTASAAIGLVLLSIGHLHGWPVVRGGTQRLADALLQYFLSLGGTVQTGMDIRSIQDLPDTRAVLFDLTPRQVLDIGGLHLSKWYRWQLSRFRYGPGVFKMDWVLSSPIPFRAAACRQAITVHLGGSYPEMRESARRVAGGGLPENPLVVLAQPTIVDDARGPAGRHIAWAYCQVPPGYNGSLAAGVEKQVERFAPGFRDCILARHEMNSRDLQHYNPNYIGGNINGGAMNFRQMLFRPIVGQDPYATSDPKYYLCSASTSPGGGVHGLCGYYAARRVLLDIFGLRLPFL